MRELRARLAVGWASRRVLELLDPVAVAVARRGLGEAAPVVPPRRLRARTGAPGARQFVEGGADAAGALTDALREAGRAPGRVCSVLDFGSSPAVGCRDR
jgi:hypothetical protein